MNSLKTLLLLSSLGFAASAAAQSPQLSHALDQVQAAKSSYQRADAQQASAHTRAALGHVEILRRDHKAEKSLKIAEADLVRSLKQNKNEAIEKAAENLDLAIERLEQYKMRQ